MNKKTCRCCLQPLEPGENMYHPACCKKLFDSNTPPSLQYTWNDLNRLAEQIINQHITVPGVQPKLSMHLEKGNRSRNTRLTLVGLEGGFILKPPVKEYPQMPELEHITMRMAECFGIDVAECGLISLEDGQQAFITKRMDRTGTEKLHMEDMCQLTDRLTEQKYRGSMEQIGKTILRYCDNALFDALRFFEVTVLSFLTGNSDMHLKNFSLLYRQNGEVSLSPAYDLLPTKLLLPADKEEMALTLNGRKKKLEQEDFMQLAKTLRLTEKQTANVYARFSSHLNEALKILDAGFCNTQMKEQYRRLIRERSLRLGINSSTS